MAPAQFIRQALPFHYLGEGGLMAASDSYFLDVERSVLGQPWRGRLKGGGAEQPVAITQISGPPDLMARVLAGRGVKLEEVAPYLDPALRDLMPDPFPLRDLGP